MRFSFNTANHMAGSRRPPTLPEQIIAAAAAGYDCMGMDVTSVLAHERQGTRLGDLAALVSASGMSVHEIVALEFTQDVAATTERLECFERIAQTLGAEQVLAIVDGDVTEAIVQVAKLCARRLAAVGVGCSIEFLANRNLKTLEEARRLCEATGVETAGVVVDSWHFLVGTSSWESLSSLPPERLGFVQFADALLPIGDDLRTETVQRRTMPGDGVLDLASFCRAVVETGYDGVVSVEILSKEWRNRPLDQFVPATLSATRRVWAAAGASFAVRR